MRTGSGPYRRVAMAALCTTAVVLLTACQVALFPFGATGSTSPTPPAGLTPAQVAVVAAQRWAARPAHRFAGSMRASGTPITVDVTMTPPSPGDALGTGTAAGAAFSFLEQNQRAYLKGQSFWQAYFDGNQQQQYLARGFQDTYTVADSNNVALALAQLPDLGGQVEQLSEGGSGLRTNGYRVIGGVRAIGLTKGSSTWWISPASGDILGWRAPTAEGLSDADFTMQASAPPTDLTGQLGSPVDPDQPSTMPARYQAVDVVQQDQSQCTQTLCGFTVTVTNDGGAPAGQGVVTVSTYPSQGSTQVLADCTADIPTSIGSGQTGTTQCGVSGPGWEQFYGTQFYVDAQVTQNPPYV